jgi:hypothetical protein
MKCIDRIGNTYGKLKVISRVDNDAQGFARFLCLCECGNYKAVRGCNLGITKSCGCIRESMTNTARERTSRYRTNPGRSVIICKTFPQEMKVKLEQLAEANGTSMQDTIKFVMIEWITLKERQTRFKTLTEPVYGEE